MEKKIFFFIEDFKVAVLDIEGTTTPISFVHDVLFAYIKSHLKQYVREHWSNPSLQKYLDLIRQQVSNQSIKKKKIPCIILKNGNELYASEGST